MQGQAFQTSQADFIDFGFHDFVNDDNFEQFIDLIRGENADPIDKYCQNFDGALMFSAGMVENQFCSTPQSMFEINSASNSNPSLSLNPLPPFGGEIERGGDEENEGDDSSGTTTTTPMKGMGMRRSRTLISERRRRGRMKEKLYSLRSLVPNITKMDKASIIGDAVSYLQELQMQAKKLKSEIAGLESSQKGISGRFQPSFENPKNTHIANNKYQICMKIIQMDVFQVEEREFYVRLVCKNGEGLAVALYKALESLSSFDVKSSNFTTVSERSILTFTIDVQESGEDVNLSTLKLWMSGALLKQGFEFKTL